MKQRRHALLGALTCGAVTALFYLPVLRNGFLNWDDDVLLRALHDRPRSFWPWLRWLFTAGDNASYQPLCWLVDSILDHLWGAAPAGHHAFGLALHAAAAALFYLVALRLLERARPGAPRRWVFALFAALLFSLHPLQAEAVARMATKAYLMGAVFFLGAILVYVRGEPDGRALAASWSLFVLSGLSRWQGACLPVLMIILDIYPLSRLSPDPRRWGERSSRRVLLEKIPFFALAAAIVAANAIVKARAFHYETTMRPMEAAHGAVLFAVKWLAPVHLMPVYAFDGLPSRLCLALAAAAPALCAAAFVWRRRWPAFAAAWAFYLTALSPIFFFAVEGQPVYAHDYHVYLAGLGFPLMAAGGLVDVLGRRPWAAAVLILPALLGFVAREQAMTWKDSVTLWTRAHSIDPRSSIAIFRLGDALETRGLDGAKAALELYRRQAEFDPRRGRANLFFACLSLARRLVAAGRLSEAAAVVGEAGGVMPNDESARRDFRRVLREVEDAGSR